MLIAVIGDSHADYGFLHAAVEEAHKRNISTLLQVGDFGIGFGEALSWSKLSRKLQRNDQKLYVVRGNHDDPNAIKALPINAEGVHEFLPNIFFIPEGHRWEWGGRTFVALGGAASVDRNYRKRLMNRSINGVKYTNKPVWWENEIFTPEDVMKVVAEGTADVMVAHDAPVGIDAIDRRINGNPFGFDAADLLYAADSRALMTEAFRGVNPQVFLHGHYHFPVHETIRAHNPQGHCVVFGLDCNGHTHSLGTLNTEDLSVEFLNPKKVLLR